MYWQVLSASVTGGSHLRSQRPCQDASLVVLTDENSVLAAVADGLGSAALAERGAQRAVQAAVTALQVGLAHSTPQNEAEWHALLQQAFAQARTAVEEQATAENGALADYASTLLVLAATADWLAVGHLGDGAVVACVAGGTMETVSPPQRGEFANETIPLTGVEALTQVRYHCRPVAVEALALFTDGLQNVCLEANSYTPYVPFFDPLFAQLPMPFDPAAGEAALASFLASDRINRRTDDDKTLVLIGRLELANY